MLADSQSDTLNDSYADVFHSSAHEMATPPHKNEGELATSRSCSSGFITSGFGFLIPLLVLIVVAFDAPIGYMLSLAFWDNTKGFTFQYYENLLEAPIYLRVLANTLGISVIVTFASVHRLSVGTLDAKSEWSRQNHRDRSSRAAVLGKRSSEDLCLDRHSGQ